MIALETVQAWTTIPFILMLLGIAVLPLIPATAKKWENWKFQFGFALILGVPTAIYMMIAFAPITLVHTAVEYVQFIALLWALFAISGGLFLEGDIRATPRNNALILAIGAVIASFIGTTGAAMLLIRPLLNINSQRSYKTQTVIFTILIVANNGGLLTPLGDPPLFMGFLRGVPFTWTFHLLPEWLFINVLLLAMYFALDTRAYAKEEPIAVFNDNSEVKPIRALGLINVVFFALVIVAVAVVPSLNLEAIEAGHALWYQWVPWREIVFGLAVLGSFIFGSKRVRYELNEFNWAPIVEVAVIFVGIFLTMQPALRYVAQIAPNLPLNDATFYIFSGALSSFLDNAPTYVTFFEMASQLPGEPLIAGVPVVYLAAISLGSVTCGAMTYIGNGPNFMVKSVADSRGVKMPSFGGYMGWTLTHLLPVLAAMAMIFIVGGIWMWIGIALTVVIVAIYGRVYLASRKQAAQLAANSQAN